MKKIIILIAILALCIAAKLEEFARYNDIISRDRDNAERAEIERLQQDERIKEIEKELRLIHTDIDIIQNGSKK